MVDRDPFHHGAAAPAQSGRRQRVTPYAALLHSRRLTGLAAAEARIADLESALANLAASAVRDATTGSLNRRGIREMFAHEAAHADRSGQPILTALIELPGLHGLRRLRGPAWADAALARLTRILLRSLRPIDLCARWDADEFLVLMPGGDSRLAAEALAPVRVAVSALAAEVAPA